MTSMVPPDSLSTVFDLPFRGTRKYLHGTDLCPAVTDWMAELAGEPTTFLSRISFHRRCQHVALAAIGLAEQPIGAFGSFSVDASGPLGPVTGWLIETAGPVLRQTDYDEEALLAGAEIPPAGDAGLLLVPSGLTTIQAVVGLSKLVSYRVAPDGGSWLFGRLDLDAPMETQVETVEVKLKRLVDNRYAVLDVYQDRRPVGEMRFIKDIKS